MKHIPIGRSSDLLLDFDLHTFHLLPKLTISFFSDVKSVSGGFLFFAFSFLIKSGKRKKKELILRAMLRDQRKGSNSPLNEWG